MAFLRAVDRAEADAFRVLVVQDFGTSMVSPSRMETTRLARHAPQNDSCISPVALIRQLFIPDPKAGCFRLARSMSASGIEGRQLSFGRLV